MPIPHIADDAFPIGQRVSLPVRFPQPVVLESVRAVAAGYECHVRSHNGILDTVVISLEEATTVLGQLSDLARRRDGVGPPHVRRWKEGMFVVRSVSWKGHMKRLSLTPGNWAMILPLSACVTKGDAVRVDSGGAQVVCTSGRARILGPYFQREEVTLGALTIEVAAKEITEEDEHESYVHLADLHYRGHEIHGRTARLILRSFCPAYPTVLGYVELATPFFMNKARSQVLDAPYRADGIGWESWDSNASRTSIHAIVRIARIVVAPEFRGAGLGQRLLKHAFQFARDRWQAAGIKPHFVEVSADMLKYVPFAERAGMHYVGHTEGNLHRVAKDMRYLIRRFGVDRTGQKDFERSCGICDEQISRMRGALEFMTEQNLTVDELISKLASLSTNEVLKDVALLHSVVVLPKPHYMKGLTPHAERFLVRRLRDLALRNSHPGLSITVGRIGGPICVSDLSISYVSRVRRTRTTHAVQQAFGISPEGLYCSVINRLTLTVEPGEILVVTGPSGSGKTSLIDALTVAGEGRKAAGVAGEIRFPPDARVGRFQRIRSRKPLIELVGAHDLKRGLHVLGLAGLSEAYLYLKRFQELSAGQQHRAMLAALLASDANVWLADEFCANLDVVTANLVASNLQKIARRAGATVVVATPDCQNSVRALKPDKILLLRSSTEHIVLTGQEFLAQLPGGVNGCQRMPSIAVCRKVLGEVKRTGRGLVICAGETMQCVTMLLLHNAAEHIPVRVTGVQPTSLSELCETDALASGFSGLGHLRSYISARYQNVPDTAPLLAVSVEALS